MSLQIVARDGEAKKPAKRYNSEDIHVTARTIGTKINFKMPVVNMSVTGMLLSWQDSKKVPFAVNTILELCVNAEGKVASANSINCLAKVVHTSTQADGRRNFGVKIIQSDDEELAAWTSVIKQIEESNSNI